MRKAWPIAGVVLFAAVLTASAQPRGPGFPPGPGGPGAPPNFNPGDLFAAGIMKAAGKTKDEDKQFTKEQFLEGAKKVFKKWDRQNKGELDEKTLAVVLNQTLPALLMPPGARPPMPPGGAGQFGPGQMIAKVINGKADVKKKGKITAVEFVAACEAFFKDSDKNNDGILNARELADGLTALLMPTAPAAPPK